LCEFLRKPIPDVPFPSGNDPQDFFRRFAIADRRRRKGVVKNGIMLLAGIGCLAATLTMIRRGKGGDPSSLFNALAKRVGFA
jgi:hypothetical protein